MLFISDYAFAQISTDRPDQTESSLVLPKGTIQIESGFVSNKNEYIFPNTLFRVGVFKKVEFRFNTNYIINKNERKIKRGDLELQLSEKEVNFLILFTEKEGPINKNTVLKNVWNYSEESETHTVETHIHRLRKKIMEKYGDKNFIKNDNKGYYI